MNHTRLLIAFALSPVAPAIVAGMSARNFGVTVVWAVFSYPFALLLGVPAYLLFRRLRWLYPTAVFVGSIVLGLLAFVPSHFILGSTLSVGTALIFAGCGALVGLVFCLIVFSGVRASDELQSSN